MASLLDHAKFSAFIYEASESLIDKNLSGHKSDDFSFQLPSGWKLTAFPNSQPTLTGNESNFAAGIFKQEGSNTAVFAFRGTQFSQLADHDANIDNTFGDGASRQAEQAYQEVLQHLKDNPDESVELTGHSQGGYEVKYVVAKLALEHRDLLDRVSCSTVNAPGLTDDMMQALRDADIDPESLPCTNAIVDGDPASRINGENQIGNETRITGGDAIHDENGNVTGYSDDVGTDTTALHKIVDAVDRMEKSDSANAELEVSELGCVSQGLCSASVLLYNNT